MSRHLIALGLAGALVVGLAATVPVQAESAPGDRPAETIRVDRWELQTRLGVARVHERLEAAARDVCRDLDSRELGMQMAYRRCVADALAHAVRDVHDSRLTAYHRDRGGLRTATIVARSPAPR
jgi:UrcA family protein